MMKCIRHLLPALLAASMPLIAVAEVQVTHEKLDSGTGFEFDSIPQPAINDAGTRATWRLIDGEQDRNSAAITALFDGQLPAGDDEPRNNFFLAPGSKGGMIVVDLLKVLPVARISSYSGHVGDRGPQVYVVFGSDGADPAFTLDPERLQNPVECGWKRIASIDTRQKSEEPGGQHGVSITDTESLLGRFRYLLFLIQPTEKRDPFGQTFFSEIDIVATDQTDLKFVPVEKPRELIRFEAADGKYKFHLDVTAAGDLKGWSEEELIPVIQEWYPKIVEMLPSEGFQAASQVRLRYRTDMPAAVPASAGGSTVNLNTAWFRQHVRGEAKGCVIHELVHVVQAYQQGRRLNPESPAVPGWLVEGLADYVRWFLYEPATGGALLSPKQLALARYDESYRVSANFLDWVVRTQDKDLIQKVNAAARSGKYDDSLWEIYTRKRLQDLAEEWKLGQ